MRNKIKVALITFLITMCCIIIFLNYSKSDSWKNYNFDRKYSNCEILKFEKESAKMSNDDYLMFIDSDTLIAESEKIDNKFTYAFYFRDRNLNNKKELKVQLPEGSNRLLCNLNEIYFTNKFKLFKHDVFNKKNTFVDIPNFKTISLRTIDFENKIYFLFGEHKKNNEFITGFYIYDFKNKNLLKCKEIAKSQTEKININILKYSGSYHISKKEDSIIYYCDKSSEIYLFDSKGKYLKTIITADQVPFPKIISNENGNNFYSRDGTWNTNMGVALIKDRLFVLSASNNNKFKITLDEYSVKTNNYVKSYLVDYKKYQSKDLRGAFVSNNKLIIVTEFNYASFILEI